MAEVMGVKTKSIKRWMERQEKNVSVIKKKTGRPSKATASVRLKIRNRYIESYKEWGPRTLANWAKREGLGDYSPTTIAKIIEDLREKTPPKEKPRRYEITVPNVMWSEDGAGFRERNRKKELLLLQDECSRFKVNTRLVDGPATASDVCDYLRQAFEKYGAPLILKHDGDSIFHNEDVQKLLDEYGVINLKSPPRYPPFNGKMERSVRDVKSYERAMRKHELGTSLEKRINSAIKDLNYNRPRPVLGGKTARECFLRRQTKLPDRQYFIKKVRHIEEVMKKESCTRKQKDGARRRAVELILLRQGLMEEIADVSTYLKQKRATI